MARNRVTTDFDNYPDLYEAMIEHIDERPEYENQSQFIRTAIRKELNRASDGYSY